MDLTPPSSTEPIANEPLPEPSLPWDLVTPEVEVVRAPRAVVQRLREVAGGGGFTIPMMCIGIGLIAACLLIPAADDVSKLAYERERLKADLEQLHKQVDTNDAFLKRVADDPTLQERLARRQLKMVPEGTAVLNLKSVKQQPDEMSPFLLVTVPPPAPMAPYRPIGGGLLADACRNPKMQLYLIGGSLMLIGMGLVLSRSSPASDRDGDEDADDAEPSGGDANAALA